MKEKALYITAIILQLGVIIYFVTRNRKKSTEEKKVEGTEYAGLRSLALSVTPEQLKLNIPPSQLFVYGVVMDWCFGEAIVTLAAYITGAANMYLNSGAEISGGGKSPVVGEIAARFVSAAQDYAGRAMLTTVADLPQDGCVRFYLLSNKGIYAAQEQMIHFENNTSAWLPLFELGNEVIAELKSGGGIGEQTV